MILHLDADAFYASVEQATDPRLRGRPIAVGGQARGVIASASYEARRLGIRTAMPVARARRICPQLILLPGDFEKYERFSRFLFSYAYDFTPLVEIASIDEAYVDLRGAAPPRPGAPPPSPRDIAATLQRAVRQALRITISEGLAQNKIASAIASKLHKPAGFLEVPPGSEPAFLAPLPVERLPGIGPRTAASLRQAGILTLGQLAATPLEPLSLLLGSRAAETRALAAGHDPRPVQPDPPAPKSWSEQETFPADTTDEAWILARLRAMADRLFAKIRAASKTIRTLEVRIRYNDMEESRRSESLPEPTDLETDAYPLIARLLRRAWQRRVSLRLVALRLSGIHTGAFQTSLPLLFDEPSLHTAPAPRNPRSPSTPASPPPLPAASDPRRQRLAAAVDTLRSELGPSAIRRAHDLFLASHPQPRDLPSPPAPTPPSKNTTPRLCPHAPPDPAPSPTPHPTPHAPSLLLPRHRYPAWAALHCRSCFDFGRSLLTPEDIVRLAAERGARAVALTDPNLHAAVRFAQAAREAGLQPVLAAEVLWQGTPHAAYVHTTQGYHHLCLALSHPARHLHPDCTSGLILRPLPRRTHPSPAPTHHASTTEPTPPSPLHPLPNNTTHPRSEFAPPPHPTDPPHPHAIPPFLLPELRAASPEDLPLLAVLHAIHTGTFAWPAARHLERLRHAATTAPHTAPAQCWFPQSPQDLTHWPRQALDDALRIADTCASFRFPDDLPPPLAPHPASSRHPSPTTPRVRLPAFHPPDGSTPAAFLRRLALEGARRRYGHSRAALRKALRQVAQELRIISAVGYENCFLLTWHFLQHCAARGISWLTRGSAADSIVCYCLGISQACPHRFDLYFQRFLNPERMALHKLPDIDLDFPCDEKDQAVALFLKLHGPRAAAVGGFSTFRARSAFAEAAKTLGLSDPQTRKITRAFPWLATPPHPDALTEASRRSGINLAEEPFRSALLCATRLEGLPRHPKMHPCGFLAADRPILTLSPLFTSAKNLPTSHFDMDAAEALGLLKMDFLAQAGLAVLRDTRHALASKHIPLPEPEHFAPWDDPAVWCLIASGEARGVHHIESPAMCTLQKMARPRRIEDLIAIVSVIRPGAANQLKKETFARRARGHQPPSTPHPSLDPILASTYGVIAYEEHVLQICETFAGLPIGPADRLRRALAKNRDPEIQALRPAFFQAAAARGRTLQETERVWRFLTAFRGYSFCRAHSTAYALEAWAAAWCKRYHPAEFFAAVLTHGKGFYTRLAYSIECRRLGIGFLPPDVRSPAPRYQPEPVPASLAPSGTALRLPLWQIKHLTHATLARIHAAAPFSSLHDFLHRTHPEEPETSALIRSGALDSFGLSRTRLFWETLQWRATHRPRQPHPASTSSPKHTTPTRSELTPPSPPPHTPHPFPITKTPHPTPLQPDLFPTHPTPLHSPASWLTHTPLLTEPSLPERLADELELLSFPVSAHPIELHPQVHWHTYCPLAEALTLPGHRVTIAGILIASREIHQTDGRPMRFLTLADRSGVAECEMFADTFARYNSLAERWPVIAAEATPTEAPGGEAITLRIRRLLPPRGL